MGHRNVRTGGFTLIELLVVIAIIGILAASAVPRIFDAICDSRVASAKSDIATVRTALVQCQRDQNCSHLDVNSLLNHDLIPERVASGYSISNTSSEVTVIYTGNVGCVWNDGSTENRGMSFSVGNGEFMAQTP